MPERSRKVKVNEQEVETEVVDHRVEDEEQVNPVLADWSLEEAATRAGKNPTTTKMIESASGVGPWLAAGHESPRDDLCAAMLPLEAKQALFACVARGEAHFFEREKNALQRQM